MNTRIKLLRKEMKLTQSEFSNRIGVSQNAIARWELGDRVPSEAIIRFICREFAISYNWLKNGAGPMRMPPEEAAKDKIERILDGDNAFAKSIFRELADLPIESWEAIEVFVDRVLAQKKDR